MSIRHRLPFLVLASALLTGSLVATAQQIATDPAAAPLTAKIPVDAAIATGQLDNGLRYYVRSNQKPEDRAELRLVVNVGSVLEEDDQLGLAHFVEARTAATTPSSSPTTPT
jgi:zinc protease